MEWLRISTSTELVRVQSREPDTRPLGEVEPGDVFVYAGADRGTTLGHAVMVIDVAENCSPWFTMDKDANFVQLSPFTYKAKELKKWN